jgi:hypothetical protein
MGLIIVVLAMLAVAAGAHRAWRRRRAGGSADIPAVVVGWAARLLSVDRAEWGQAMLGELSSTGIPPDGDTRWVAPWPRSACPAVTGVVGGSWPRSSGPRSPVPGVLLYMSVTTAVLGAAGAVVARRRS